MRYDIILFENFHSAFHHKYDVYLIARLLKSKGMRVAILNIYGEDKAEDYVGIDMLDLPFNIDVPNDKTWIECKNSSLKRLFFVIRFLYQQMRYMKKVRNFVEDKADMFYMGSYHLLMPAVFFEMKKPCFYWGLRSSRMTGFWHMLTSNPCLAYRVLYLKNRFLKNKFQKLFVSNDIIKQEFVKIGIPEDRLIIREERCVEGQQEFDASYKNKNFSLLVIGGIRKQKHIELTTKAFKQTKIDGGILRLVGENSDCEYEEVIQNEIYGNKNIERVNRRLEYEEFYSFLKQAHFTLFADEKGRSSVTNGTLMESIINYTPFIAPDYEPYSYYVRKYGIGLTYKPGDVEAYAVAIKKAYAMGYGHFIPQIVEFQKTIKFSRVATQLANDILENQIRIARE